MSINIEIEGLKPNIWYFEVLRIKRKKIQKLEAKNNIKNL